MSSSNILREAASLIRNSPALQAKDQEYWLRKATGMSPEELRKLVGILQEEQAEILAIRKKQENEKRTRVRAYKAKLDHFQHHDLPHLFAAIESEDHTAEMRKTEHLLDEL